MNVAEFGICEGISEVILTTLSPAGKPNAAPMGLHKKDGRLFLMVYDSTTLTNILEDPVAAANIVDDPVLFVKSALSDVTPERYEFIEGFPVLRDSLGWIVFECTCKKGKNISVVELSPLRGEINRRVIKPVNRGYNAVIEAAIYATRYVSLGKREYLRQIENCDAIVRKCGGAGEKEAMRLLYELIGCHPKHTARYPHPTQ